MKKIIDGKIYNTETADLLYSDDNGLGHSDFNFVDETLYKTKKGKYFVHGEGGAMTDYGKNTWGNARCAGEDILPLSTQEAIALLEKYNAHEVLLSEFSDYIEEA